MSKSHFPLIFCDGYSPDDFGYTPGENVLVDYALKVLCISVFYNKKWLKKTTLVVINLSLGCFWDNYLVPVSIATFKMCAKYISLIIITNPSEKQYPIWKLNKRVYFSLKKTHVYMKVKLKLQILFCFEVRKTQKSHVTYSTVTAWF